MKGTGYRVQGIVLAVFLLLLLPVAYCLMPIAHAASSLDAINQRVCDRLENDTSRLAAIMTEFKARQGITETRVAYGGSDTPIKQADYWVNYAAEAIAYERAQKFSGAASLRSNLQVLAGKVLKAKQAVGVAIQ